MEEWDGRGGVGVFGMWMGGGAWKYSNGDEGKDEVGEYISFQNVFAKNVS